MHPLARLDLQYVWHPFTQMHDWLKSEPIVIVEGRGAVLRDVHGHEYLDANASIWTNLHGHHHPAINRALVRQLGKIAHSSALGLANEPASLLAKQLVAVANLPPDRRSLAPTTRPKERAASSAPHLAKVFFSDDGSTAIEVALKLAYEYARRTRPSRPPRFLSLAGAYHGDTVGAVSLGHIDLFHRAYAGLLFRSDQVMAPYCYRCPFNRARPERADARHYRQCHWECVDEVERCCARQRKRGGPYAAMVIEPLIQGAAGMIPQPSGWLRRVVELARAYGSPWIADEVMTGFGRTGVACHDPALGARAPSPATQPGDPSRSSDAPAAHTRPRTSRPHSSSRTADQVCSAQAAFPAAAAANDARLFAAQAEGVVPDYLAVAKGLTGGYLPLAATLTTLPVFEAFLGEYAEFRTFFHGHSYTGNQLGAVAAQASLRLLQTPASITARRRLEEDLAHHLASLWPLPSVGDIRQVGLIAGIELVRDWRTREPFPLAAQAGSRVTAAMARRGVLTRPIGNVLVLMPPYCTTRPQVAQMVGALRQSIQEVLE